MTLLTSVKNSDSGFKKASKNIQVGNMKMISLKGLGLIFNIFLYDINLSPELIKGRGSGEHRTSVGEASLIKQPQLVAVPGENNDERHFISH